MDWTLHEIELNNFKFFYHACPLKVVDDYYKV